MFIEKIGTRYIAQTQPKVGLPAIGEGKNFMQAIERAFNDMQENNVLFK